jgi:ubiquinone/menaquinone biosynthesis C-methylase UbiE
MDQFIYEIFKDLPRLGPGSAESTRKAYYTLQALKKDTSILDIGCGTGSQTISLARLAPCQIVALDNYEPYLRELNKKAAHDKLNDKIHALRADMTHLPFSEAKFDVIWCEAAIYNIGFEVGLREWKDYLVDNGFLVVSELCWLKPSPPGELARFWHAEYPGMKDIQTNLAYIEDAGYSLLRSFILPESDWLKDFYVPLEKRVNKLIEKYKYDPDKKELLDGVLNEIDIYRAYSDYYGYVFFIMEKM